MKSESPFINWQQHPISVKHEDTVLKGAIVYWAKCYNVVLNEPIKIASRFIQMPYYAPARFVISQDAIEVPGIKNVDVVVDATEKLKRLYIDGMKARS